MGLGYRGNDAWRDMSEYVVHFTKGADASAGYDTLLRILWSGVITELLTDFARFKVEAYGKPWFAVGRCRLVPGPAAVHEGAP
jgi:hypothetical protein